MSEASAADRGPQRTQALAVFGLVVGLGLVVWWALQPNPYASPETTFNTAMAAIEARDADAAWACVTFLERKQCSILARRIVGSSSEEPLTELFDQGVERYGVGRGELLSLDPDPNDEARVHVRVAFGEREIRLIAVESGGQWRFEGVVDAIMGSELGRRAR